MEGFNPDQSLLPSVGGNITPMSGGGQEGGLTVAGVTSILGLNETDFKKPENEAVLKAIAPNQIGTTSINAYWDTKKDSAEDDEVLKRNILDTILSTPDYIEKLKFLIESETPLKDEEMPAIVESLKTSIDLKNVTITLNDTELKVVIKMPSATPPSATPLPVATSS
jgi:hypothetical protein